MFFASKVIFVVFMFYQTRKQAQCRRGGRNYKSHSAKKKRVFSPCFIYLFINSHFREVETRSIQSVEVCN